MFFRHLQSVHVVDCPCSFSGRMKRPLIPDDVRQFVQTSVPSVPYLEALLLMRGSDEHGWNGSALAQALYMNEHTASALLDTLRQAGMIAPATADGERMRYAPPAHMAALIDRLAEVYASNLIGVSTLIHAS